MCAAATQPFDYYLLLVVLFRTGGVMLCPFCSLSLVRQQHVFCHVFCITWIVFQELSIGPSDDPKHTKCN